MSNIFTKAFPKEVLHSICNKWEIAKIHSPTWGECQDSFKWDRKYEMNSLLFKTNIYKIENLQPSQTKWPTRTLICIMIFLVYLNIPKLDEMQQKIPKFVKIPCQWRTAIDFYSIKLYVRKTLKEVKINVLKAHWK